MKRLFFFVFGYARIDKPGFCTLSALRPFQTKISAQKYVKWNGFHVVGFWSSPSLYVAITQGKCVVPCKCRTMQVCRTMPSRRASVSYHLSAIVDKKGFFNRDIKSRPLPIVLHSPPLVPTGTEILFLSISKFILTGKAVCHVLYVWIFMRAVLCKPVCLQLDAWIKCPLHCHPFHQTHKDFSAQENADVVAFVQAEWFWRLEEPPLVLCLVVSLFLVRRPRHGMTHDRVGQNRVHCIRTVYDPISGDFPDFPAKNTMYKPYKYGSGQPYTWHMTVIASILRYVIWVLNLICLAGTQAPSLHETRMQFPHAFASVVAPWQARSPCPQTYVHLASLLTCM
jgi:hypothetical protein